MYGFRFSSQILNLDLKINVLMDVGVYKLMNFMKWQEKY